jgi:hypothetical protein
MSRPGTVGQHSNPTKVGNEEGAADLGRGGSQNRPTVRSRSPCPVRGESADERGSEFGRKNPSREGAVPLRSTPSRKVLLEMAQCARSRSERDQRVP